MKTIRANVPLVFLTFLFIALQLRQINVNVKSDEIFSHLSGAGISNLNLDEVSESSVFDQHALTSDLSFQDAIKANLKFDRSVGISYVIPLHALMKVFGPTHWVGRGFSLLLGVLTIWLFASILKRWEPDATRRHISLFLLAFNPLFYLYSGYMRHYMFPLFFLLLSFYLILRIIDHHGNSKPIAHYVGLLGAITIAAFGHHLAFLVIGFIWLIPIFLWFQGKLSGRVTSALIGILVISGVTFILTSFALYQLGVYENFASQSLWLRMANGEIPDHGMFRYGMITVPSPYWLMVQLGRTSGLLMGADLLFLEILTGQIGASFWLVPLGIFVVLFTSIRYWSFLPQMDGTKLMVCLIPLAWVTAAIIIAIFQSTTLIFLERYQLFIVPFGILGILYLISKSGRSGTAVLGLMLVNTLFFCVPRILGKHISFGDPNHSYKYWESAQFIENNYSSGDTVVYSNDKTAMTTSLYLLNEESEVISKVATNPKLSELEVQIYKSEDTVIFIGGKIHGCD